MNGFSSLDETYRKYSIALIWMISLDFEGHRSKVKVTAVRRIGEGIDVDAGPSKSVL